MINLTEDLKNQLVIQFPPMLNNFKKITGWILNGETEDAPMPGALKTAKDNLDNLLVAVPQQQKEIEALKNQVAQLTKANNELATAYNDKVKSIDAKLKEMDDAIAKAGKKTTRRTKKQIEADKKAEQEAQAAKEAQANAVAKADAQAAPNVDAITVSNAQSVSVDEIEATAAAVGAGELSESATAQVDAILQSL